ncbi:MAG: FKBP-type peptidyl-prolyl cis-trans isomerase [candidate division Zixibacteria bacterium]|nr:FKBP-type peptidyl-prolyl cis-trans isomerase [candidate division Zixibacteria bacterium]
MKNFGYLALSLLILCLAGCGTDSADKTETQTDLQSSQAVTDGRQTAENDPNLVTLPSGVRYIDLETGTGEELVHGTYVQWDYSLFLADPSGLIKAQPVASTVKQPDDFYRGQAGVTGLKGLAEGVIGMKVGGLRRIHVPWELGWGEAGPMPKQNLIFEIRNLALISREEAEQWQLDEYTRRQTIEQETRRRQDSVRQDSINQIKGQ